MRTIKFRGRDKRGNVFYGAYNQDMGCIDDWEYAASYAVDDEDVAQLCGLDKNGREVYEGDILLGELDNEHVAEIYDLPNFLASLTLKEATHDQE